MTEPLSPAVEPVTGAPRFADTWASVMRHQLDFVQDPSTRQDRLGSDVPSWALAEAGEVHILLKIIKVTS